MSRLIAVAANTYRETVRERVLYNLVFFAILMTLSGLFLAELSVRQDDRIIKDIGLASMELFGTFIAIFVGVGLVSKEIERRSLYPLLAKPLTRTEFLLGKFCGLGLTLLVNCAVMTVGLFATLRATGRPPDVRLLLAIYPIFLSLLLTVALALFLSTLTSSALAAAGTFGLVVAGRFSDVIRNMQQVAPGVPGWIVDLLYYGLPNLRNFDVKDRVIHGDLVSASDLGWITLYALVYGGVVLFGAMAAFRAKDLR